MRTGHLKYDRDEGGENEEALLLRELQHRVSNEIQASVSAMQLVKHAGGKGPRAVLLDQALDRMYGFGQVHNILSARVDGALDLAGPLRSICHGLLAGRPGLDVSHVSLTLPQTVIDGVVARRILLIAAELIFNAVRHALAGRNGALCVSIAHDKQYVTLAVSDNGPGLSRAAATRGTGLGSSIVAELVRSGKGVIECDTGVDGTCFSIRMPLVEEDFVF